MKKLINFELYDSLSENMIYHIENHIPLYENVFRVGSTEYLELIKEARFLYDNNLEFEDDISSIFESTDLGLYGIYEGEEVPLDFPILLEAEYKGREVELNKPMRSSGPKKFKVYVKNPKTGKVKLIHFGDAKHGLTAKIDDPEARKSFVARHKCELKDDKMTAGYWSCRLPRFKNLYKGTYNGFW
jgi:hypothetical protein